MDLAAEMGPALTAADLSPSDLDRAPEACLDRILALGRDYAALRTQHASLDAQCVALSPERAAAAALSDTEARSAAKARTEAAERQARLIEARTARAGLLGGEATGPHRTRLNNERRAARETLQAAQAASAEAARALTGAVTEAAAAAAALERPHGQGLRRRPQQPQPALLPRHQRGADAPDDRHRHPRDREALELILLRRRAPGRAPSVGRAKRGRLPTMEPCRCVSRSSP